ncbi:hypothetical protein F3Y22_tig00110343pilonHSYRG00012 [Hibiscus syriacus]|uniref:Uncharacterized protein n=1 Tax=Hibiscus syriacus TaxID=106335 RepID=A0A6A3AX12_HIBSY|nr:hypothetical protein F3Y22_tig00110343pilonHSYRG00012 [Hibiscus syriacus]
MEVVVPVPAAAVEFNLDNTYSSPYMTAPSSPQSFIFSAPTSPSRASSFAAVPFDWEEKPGVPKRKDFHGRIDKKDETNNDDDVEDFDFEFEFSGQFERTSLSAEQLFDGGKIRPLKPPPGFSALSTTECVGREGTRNDYFGKYAVLSKKDADDVNNLSFRSTESVGSSRRISAHELHYKANRAMSEEMRRKTFLPYKRGLLGCMGFNPGLHEVSRGYCVFDS